MLKYTIRRVLLAIPTLLGVAVLVFFMLRVVPGDMVEIKRGGEGAAVSEETLNMERTRLGLNKPLSAQFADWMIGLVTLDVGKSMWTGNSVSYEIAIRLELSLEVAVLATLIAVLIALPAGTIAALYKDTWIDYVIRVLAIAGLAVPSFWLGMLFILGLLIYFSWLPPITFTPLYKDPIPNPPQLIWPALAAPPPHPPVPTPFTPPSVLNS